MGYGAGVLGMASWEDGREVSETSRDLGELLLEIFQSDLAQDTLDEVSAAVEDANAE